MRNKEEERERKKEEECVRERACEREREGARRNREKSNNCDAYSSTLRPHILVAEDLIH